MINDRYSVGGAEQVAESLRAGLVSRGHEVRTMSATGDPRVEYPCWSTEAWFQPLVRLANPSAVRTIYRALRVFQPHVVHLGMFMHQLSPFILAALRGYPTLYYATLYEADCPKGTRWLPRQAICTARAGLACGVHCLSPHAWLALMAQRKVMRYWLDSLNEIVAVSHHLAGCLKADGLTVTGVIYPGVAAVRASAAPGPDPVVACVARFIPEKGLDTLLQAFALVVGRLPAARLWLIGEGPDRARLQSICDALNLGQHVVWFGRLTREQIDQQLATAWVQSIPSRWAETFGMVSCEAAALGLPVVVSNVGGLPETLEPGVTGLVVEPGKPDQLAVALLSLLRDPALAREMGRLGLRRASSTFSLDAFVGKFEQRYHALVSVREAPAKCER